MIYCWRAIVELQTPLHCGGGKENGFYQPVLRDALGCYRIPGSSLAGVLRSYAAARFPEHAVNRAFGNTAQMEEATGLSSAIWCHDAPVLDFDGIPATEKLARGERVAIGLGPYIRDHVCIDEDTGAAAEGTKFDEEFVPAGSRFALAFTLDGWMAAPAADLMALFDELRAALEAGQIYLGGKQAEGFGRIRVMENTCRVFDLTTPDGMRAWLNISQTPLFAPHEGAEYKGTGLPAKPPQHEGISGELVLPLEAYGPLLIGGGADAAADVDIGFYSEPYNDYEAQKVRIRRVVPGSSLRGALRHRVSHIARTLRLDHKATLAELFGSTDGKNVRPGKISVEDAPLEEVKPLPVQHVAIDRFTGGALEGALYSEGPLWRDALKVPLRLRFSGIAGREAALLLHALLDLCQGKLPIGAGGNRGNGALRLPGVKEKGWPEALQGEGVHFTLRREGDILDGNTRHNWRHWLEHLEKALHGGAA